MFPGYLLYVAAFQLHRGLPVSENDRTKEDASVGGYDGQLLIMVGGVGVRRALRADVQSRNLRSISASVDRCILVRTRLFLRGERCSCLLALITYVA